MAWFGFRGSVRGGFGLALIAGIVLTFSCWVPPPEEECGGVCNPAESMCPCENDGCCTCHCDGVVSCVPLGIKTCHDSTCYDLTRCAELDSCVQDSFGATCADSAAQCDKVRAAYDWTIAVRNLANGVMKSGMTTMPGSPSCYAEGDCTPLPGNCDAGLDTCWLTGPPDLLPELNRLAGLYRKLGCPAPSPCSCPPMPTETWCQFEPGQRQGYCVVK